MTKLKLQLENSRYRGTRGVSSHSRCAGFRPAFMDSGTRAVYLSCFADGRMAPFHTLDGLPRELVLGRSARGRVAVIKPSVISGFVRAGVFYTRDEAAALVGVDRRFGQARLGSVKRVAAAVGEESAAVQFVHRALQE